MVVQDIRGHHARLPYPKQVYEILGNWPNVANFYTQGTFQLNAQQRTIILGTIFAHQHAGVFQNRLTLTTTKSESQRTSTTLLSQNPLSVNCFNLSATS